MAYKIIIESNKMMIHFSDLLFNTKWLLCRGQTLRPQWPAFQVILTFTVIHVKTVWQPFIVPPKRTRSLG